MTLNLLPLIRICYYSLHLQIPLSQVLSFANNNALEHNTNNTIEHGSSQPSMQKQRGQCGVTIDYCKWYQQVPLSWWPMTQLDQRIKKSNGSTIMSTLDIASGFWTIPVHPHDQHKLAYTFGNRQYTFTRCPFGYSNSPA